jgi:hypothetical protein
MIIIQKLKILIIGCMLNATLSAQKVNNEEAAIHQTVESMFATLIHADTAALKNFLTSNVRFYEYGQVWNMDTLIQKVMQSKLIPDFKRTNNFEFVETTINKNTAWVTYYLQSTIYRYGKEEIIKWMETVILFKVKKQWRIKVLHSTRLVAK